MAKAKPSTKSIRRPQPAKPIIQWMNYYNNRPSSPLQQRRLIRRAVLEMDAQAVRVVYGIAISFAVDSHQRADSAELARIKAAAARQHTIPADEIVHINDLTPTQAKRLKTMTVPQLKVLAKRQARARGKGVRP